IMCSNAAISSGRAVSRSMTTTVTPSVAKLSTLATVPRTTRSSIAPLAPNVALTDCSNAGSAVKTATTVLLAFEDLAIRIRVRSERYLVGLLLLLLPAFGDEGAWLFAVDCAEQRRGNDSSSCGPKAHRCLPSADRERGR